MKFIVILTRNANLTPDKLAEHGPAEAKTALTFMVEDFAREVYSRTDGKGAIMVVEAADEAAVDTQLKRLPFVQNGFLDYEIYGTKVYRGIEAAAQA